MDGVDKQTNEKIMPIFKIKGQVNHITEPHVYNKKQNIKMTVCLAVPNAFTTNRLEMVPFDFMELTMPMLSSLQVGDYVEIDFELRGRKWADQEGNVNFYYNNEAIDLNIIEND
jgi:hypothetical protein